MFDVNTKGVRKSRREVVRKGGEEGEKKGEGRKGIFWRLKGHDDHALVGGRRCQWLTRSLCGRVRIVILPASIDLSIRGVKGGSKEGREGRIRPSKHHLGLPLAITNAEGGEGICGCWSPIQEKDRAEGR